VSGKGEEHELRAVHSLTLVATEGIESVELAGVATTVSEWMLHFSN